MTSLTPCSPVFLLFPFNKKKIYSASSQPLSHFIPNLVVYRDRKCTMDHPFVPSERLRRTLDFIKRANEQLVEKRNNAKTLVAAEDLYVDEKKFGRLVHINLTSLTPEEQLYCASLLIDLGELTDDLKVSREHRLKYRADRRRFGRNQP